MSRHKVLAPKREVMISTSTVSTEAFTGRLSCSWASSAGVRRWLPSSPSGTNTLPCTYTASALTGAEATSEAVVASKESKIPRQKSMGPDRRRTTRRILGFFPRTEACSLTLAAPRIPANSHSHHDRVILSNGARCEHRRTPFLGEVLKIPLPRTWVNSVRCSQGIEGKEEVPTMEVISRRWLR
jgi:hypothetical protein